MRYDNNTCNQFVADMEEAGYKVEHYCGRNFWEGPAVRVYENYQAVFRATKVRLQTDRMGLGRIWYPVKSGKLVDAA